MDNEEQENSYYDIKTEKGVPFAKAARPIPRRSFLQAALIAAGGFVVGLGLARPKESVLVKAGEYAPPPPTPTVKPSKNNPQLPQEQVKQPVLAEKTHNPERIMINQLNEILKMRLDDPKRLESERQYAETFTDSLSGIDKGLAVIANYNLRETLLQKRYELRLLGKEGLKPLNEAQLKWAKELQVDPEVLALSLEAFDQAVPIIAKLFDQNRAAFRPDLLYEVSVGHLAKSFFQTVSPSDLCINAGGLAKLSHTETEGLKNVGDKPAISEINPAEFPNDKRCLSVLLSKLSEDTNLNYVLENIPGSIKGPTDKSGGAIGPQMMPSKALQIYELMASVGEKFNPFTPLSSLVGSMIFLAQGEKVYVKDKTGRETVDYRYGYLRGIYLNIKGIDMGQVIRERAIFKWNPNPDQIKKIIDAASNFWQRFIGA